jgi:hypothetical protein
MTPFPNDIYARLERLEKAVRLVPTEFSSCDEREESARRARVMARTIAASIVAGRRIATDLESRSIYSPLPERTTRADYEGA